MRGRTNAIDVGVSVIGEVQLCEVAESSRIEKGEFVETFYRGKTGKLPTLFAGYSTSNYYAKTNNYLTKVPNTDNLFILRTEKKLVDALVLKLYEYDIENHEFVEKFSYNYGYIPSTYGETYLLFVNEQYFVVYGYSSGSSKDYIALFKMSEDKNSFSLIQSFESGLVTQGNGKVFVRRGNVVIFNYKDPKNLYVFTFNGQNLSTSYVKIPITYEAGLIHVGSGYSVEYTAEFISSADIAQLSEDVFAYTAYDSDYYNGSDYYYMWVLVLTISEDSSSAYVKKIDDFNTTHSTSTSSSFSYLTGPFNVARLTDEFFVVNGGPRTKKTNADIARIYHINDGLILEQKVNIGTNGVTPIRNLLEVEDGVVFGFSGTGILKLIFDIATRTLVWGWNNDGEYNTLKRAICKFENDVLFVLGIDSGTREDNDADYTFYTLKDGNLSYGFDGADGLVNLVRSYSGGKITGVANQSGNEGDVIEINVPLAIT